MATQNLSSLFPQVVNAPESVLVDPVSVATFATGVIPSFDYRLTASDCVPSGQFSRLSTGYRTVASGLLQSVAAGVLRIDHDPVTGVNLGGLIEDSRTNYVLQSSAIISGTALKSPWTDVGGASYKTDGTLAPDGSLATLITSNGSADDIVYQSIGSFAAGTVLTAGAFFKPSTTTFVNFGIFYPSNTNGSVYITVNLATLTVTSGTGGVRQVGGGFYFVWLTSTVPSSPGAARLDMRAYHSATATGSSGDSVYHGGSQFELGAFPTSYIPTTTATVTRAADVLNVPVTSDWFNPVEGTIYADFVAPPLASGFVPGLFCIDDGTSANGVQAYFNGTNPVLIAQVTNAAANPKSPSVSTANGITTGTASRTAISYTANGALAALNGGAPVSLSQTFPSGLTTLRIGQLMGGGYQPFTQIRRLAYMPRAASAPVLQKMTT